MADITTDFWQWSSTAASNSPSGSTAIGTGLDDNLRAIQAAVRAALEPLTAVAGTNTITGSMTGLSAYVSGMRVRFVPANSNTGAATINVNSIGGKNIFVNGAALVGYEIRKNCPVELYYDGTQFNIIGGAHGGDGIPIATISDRAYSTAPGGQLLCDGSAVSRTTYADLFAVVGTTWGAGNGTTTFNVPSLARRVTVGSGGSATSTLSNTVGSTGGEETHILTATELPTVVGSLKRNGTPTAGVDGSGIAAASYDGNNNAPVDIVNPTGGVAHNVMQPSAVVYKCIKV